MTNKSTEIEILLLNALQENGLTFAAAESCTGGLICQRLTAIPGSSLSIMGGVMSYAPSVKTELLGVSDKTLESFGVVSCECALEMARGVRLACSSSIGVSVTGVAGPGGGSEETPVGCVCFGISTEYGDRTCKQLFDASLGREGIRSAAADFIMTETLKTVKDLKKCLKK